MKHTQEKPLISVVMPVHNAGLYLRESIESILNQTYKNIEIIIVDDGSTDDSWKIIRSYKKQYPTIVRAIRNIKALGKSGDPATNMAIMIAKGKYIAKMDGDDIAHHRRLEKQLNFLEKNPEIFMVGTQATVIDKEGKILGTKNTPLTHEEIYENFFLYSYVIHPTIMFRNANKGKKFYDIKYPCFNEYYTFFRLMTEGKRFANLPESLIYYRVHGKNDTLTHTKKKYLSATLPIRRDFIIKFGYSPTFKQFTIAALQTIFVYFVPEKLILTLYLLARSVITPDQVVDGIKNKIATTVSSFFKFPSTVLAKVRE
jgi:glycosyltransferase involved in cell wall biosynthesis